MYIPRQPSTVWKVLIICLQAIAITSTSLRLLCRYRRGRFWLDDCLLVPVVFLNAIATIIIWFLYDDGSYGTHSARTQKALYWSSSISWLGIIWLTHISLALSLSRIFPAWGTIRRSSRGISITFVIFYVGAMSWLCTSSCAHLVDPANKPGANILDCDSERRGLTITNFVADIVASCILIFYLIFILGKTPMDRGQTILVITLLVSCVFVLLSSVLYCAFSFSPAITGPGRQFVAGMLSEIETGISVIACNTLAFVTYILSRNDPRSHRINDEIEWRKPQFQEGKTKENLPTNAHPLKANLSSNHRKSEWYPDETFAKAVVGSSN